MHARISIDFAGNSTACWKSRFRFKLTACLQKKNLTTLSFDEEKALVAGALGVIGRSLIQELEKQQDWEIVGISRRVPERRQINTSPGPAGPGCLQERAWSTGEYPPVLLRLPAKADLGGTHNTQPGDVG